MSGYQSYPGVADPYAGAASVDDPLVARDFGGWFQRVIGVVKRSFPQLALLALINALVSALFGVAVAGLVPDFSGYAAQVGSGGAPDPASIGAAVGPVILVSVIGALVSVVVGAFVQGASIFVAVRDAVGRSASAADGLRFAATRVLPLIGWSVVAGLMFAILAIPMIVAVAFGKAAIAVVALLVIVAAAYLVVAIVSLPAVVVIERGSLGRCFTLIKKRWWPTFGRLIVAGIIGFIYYAVVAAIAGALGGPDSATTAIVQALLFIPMTVFITAVVLVTYAELRSREHDSVSSQTLAAELER
jgi:hypothetical protein